MTNICNIFVQALDNRKYRTVGRQKKEKQEEPDIVPAGREFPGCCTGRENPNSTAMPPELRGNAKKPRGLESVGENIRKERKESSR